MEVAFLVLRLVAGLRSGKPHACVADAADSRRTDLARAAAVLALAAIGAGGWSLEDVLNIADAGTNWAPAALVAAVAGGLASVLGGRVVSGRATGHDRPTAS